MPNRTNRHIRFRLYQAKKKFTNIISFYPVITIYKCNIMTSRNIQSCITCSRKPTISLMNHTYTFVFCRPLITQIRTGIRRTIIH